jgi:hypothetical protein
VRLVYESGSRTGVKIGGGIIGDAIGSLVSVSHDRSSLAERLAPPEKMTDGSISLLSAIGASCLASGLLFVFWFTQALVLPAGTPQAEAERELDRPAVSSIAMATMVPLSLIGVICLIIAYFRWRSANAYNTEVWPEVYADWERSFLCLRCGETWTPP